MITARWVWEVFWGARLVATGPCALCLVIGVAAMVVAAAWRAPRDPERERVLTRVAVVVGVGGASLACAGPLVYTQAAGRVFPTGATFLPELIVREVVGRALLGAVVASVVPCGGWLATRGRTSLERLGGVALTAPLSWAGTVVAVDAVHELRLVYGAGGLAAGGHRTLVAFAGDTRALDASVPLVIGLGLAGAAVAAWTARTARPSPAHGVGVAAILAVGALAWAGTRAMAVDARHPLAEDETFGYRPVGVPFFAPGPCARFAFAPVLTVSGGALALDGTTMDADRAVADLQILARNWTILHPMAAFPATLHLAVEDRELSEAVPTAREIARRAGYAHLVRLGVVEVRVRTRMLGTVSRIRLCARSLPN